MHTAKHGRTWNFLPFCNPLVCLLAGALAAWGAAPPNNNFGGRVPLTGPYTTGTGFNTGATVEAGEQPAYYDAAFHTVWWSWTAPYSGIVEINTIGSDFDTVVAVYTNNLPGVNAVTNLTKIAANDDYTNFQSRVIFTAEEGMDYFIQVDGFNGYVGHITLTARMGPVVSITAPLENEIVMIPPAATKISADASAYGADVVRVDFFLGANKLGQVLSAPFSLVWTNLIEGRYTMTARAVDSGGLTNISAPVSFSVKRYPPPVVAITSPENETFHNVPGPITISADAQAGDGYLTQVEFFEGTNKLGEATSEPYSMIWSEVFPGPYVLSAIATDNHGQKTVSDPVSITVTGMPPAISITGPQNGSSLITPGTVPISVNASAAVGSIWAVEFFQASTKLGQATNLPFSLVWSNPLPGNYSITARATDSYGLTNASLPVAITVVLGNNLPPSVSILSPTEGSSFPASATVALTARAYDKDDAVAKVEFYGNGTKIGTASNPTLVNGTNWMFSLNICNVLQPGSCVLSALAIDSLGATSAISAPINVIVTRPTTTEWVAYNDDVAGSDSSANATLFTSPSISGGVSHGPLRDIATGDTLPVSLSITNTTPGISPATTMSAPAAGTPAAEIFSDYVDFDMGANRNGLEFTGSSVIGYTFTGLSTNKVYRFMATAVRGGVAQDYWARWTKVQLVGASLFTPAHSANVITLSPSQAAFNSGVNNTPTTGDIVDWDNIVPGPNGSFTVLCSKYNGTIPGGSASTGTKCYALAGIRLEQTSGQLLVNLTKPDNNSWFSYPASVTVSASAQGLPVPTNVQFYANNSLIGSKASPPYTITWGSATIRDYRLTTVARSSAGSFTSTVVNVSISNNIPPVASLDSPAPGEIFGNVETIPLTAIASDLGGTVTRVDFYANNTLLGADTINPYHFDWSGMSAGIYTITAVATDNGGLTATSAPVNIEVRSGSVLHIYDGPFLQMSTPNSMVVCWRTTLASDSRVHYGTNLSNLNLVVQDGTSTTNHQMLLSSLQPDTRYFYTVESTSQILAQGSNYFFYSAPASTQPIRIWVIGDTKTGNADERACRDAYYQYTGSQYTDLWLMGGDDAGETGTDAQFHTQFFGIFWKLLRQTVVYPSIGNHDAVFSSTAAPYINIFDLPTQGEAGGWASGDEHYYSYDYANVHFVALDSTTVDRSTSGAMYKWLTNDLAGNNKDWLIAYWHHAPYSKGPHDSDSSQEPGMREMRQNFVPVLEAHGVDLVLTGHSHDYERSYLIDGHYGLSSTFNPATMLKDGGNGRPDGTGAYRKPRLGPDPHSGTVYNLVGCTGLISSGGMLNHPAMYFSRRTLGSLVIDIDGNRLDAKYLRETGAIDDHYTIIKGTTLRITSITVKNGSVRLEWDANAGQGYQVLYKNSLNPNATWTPASSRLQASSSRMTWSHTPAPGSAGFYMVEQVP